MTDLPDIDVRPFVPEAKRGAVPVPSSLRERQGIAAFGLAALGAAAALAYARRRRNNDSTMATSPAVLDGTPRRRLYRGRDPDRAVAIEDLRAMAHRRLPRFALEYLEGGAEEEAALARNRAAFCEWRFKHRSFVDVSNRDLSTELLGRMMTMPVAIAPTGLNELFWPYADLRLAEAAAAVGIPFAQSTMSNERMERVARVPGLDYWWQLYVFGREEIRDTLIARARQAGCEALIVTDDAQLYGNREWARRNNGSPKNLTWSAKLDAACHPAWLLSGLATQGMPSFANVIEFVPKDRRRFFDSAFWIRSKMDRALSWDAVGRIRDRWPGKLILKGILDMEDVERAERVGADAVALSNHGGRQLDWTVSPLDLLPAVRASVGNRLTVLVDGGIRRGSDIVKALALGADAVMVGRATLYGVAAAGRAGAKRALDILREELDRDLGLLGVTSVRQVSEMRRLLIRT
jgi:(S)-mandelate dehydrogenase